MKFAKRLLLLTVLIRMAVSVNGQTTFFSESFGTAGNQVLLENFTGYDSNTPITFESISDADLRNTNHSFGEYPEASGGNNVFLSDNTEGFIIKGINSSAYTDIFLSFGGHEATANHTGLNDNVLSVDWSTDDGNNWSIIPFTAGDKDSWSSSMLSSTTGSVGAGTDLWLRFRSNVVSMQDIRIDDVSLSGIPEPSTYALLMGISVLGFEIRRRRKTIHPQSP